MKNKNYVVGIGEALLDCFPNSDKEKKHETRKLGGAPTIFAYHAAQSGWKGMIISAIGDDSNGKEIKKEIKKKQGLGACLETIKGKHEHPSVVAVKYKGNDKNNPSYSIDKKSAWSEIPYSDKLIKIAKKTKAVYFGTLASYCGMVSKNTIDSFLEIVRKDDDCLRIFDVNLRTNTEPNNEDLFTNSLIIEYIEKCNVLKVNRYELKYICKLFFQERDESERKKCLEIMNKFDNIKILILTMGEDGSSILWRDKKHDDKYAFSSLGMPLNVENNVGAGDALAGAFIGEILRGKTPDQAHLLAVQRSAIVCEKGDSMPPISRHDVFISYASEDKLIVNNYFCNGFIEKGISFWIDKKGLRFGDVFAEEIDNAIRDCEAFIFFYSKNAKKSEWVHKEIEKARKYRRPIIPILLDNLDDEPYEKDNPLYNESVAKLLKDIHHLDYSLSRLIDSIEERLNPQSV